MSRQFQFLDPFGIKQIPSPLSRKKMGVFRSDASSSANRLNSNQFFLKSNATWRYDLMKQRAPAIVLGVFIALTGLLFLGGPVTVYAGDQCTPTDLRYANGSLPPSDYNTLVPPNSGDSYCDPTFGTEVKRITNSAKAEVTNSEIAYFNIDDSYFIAVDDNISYLMDGKDGHKIKALGGGSMRPWWIRWPRGNSYTLSGVKRTFAPAQHFYKYEGNEIRLYNVDTLAYVVLHKFSEYSEIGPAGGEGDLSKDGRYWLLDGKRISDGKQELFVYDLLDDKKENPSSFDLGNVGGDQAGVDYATISPSGKYIVIAWHAGSSDPFNGHYGVEIFERDTWKFVRRVHPSRIHFELGYDTNGNEVFFACAGNSSEEVKSFNIPGLALGDVISVRLVDGVGKKLLDVPSYGGSLLAFADGQNQRIFIALEPRSDSPEKQWSPYWGEIFAVSTDGSGKVVRFVHHRSTKVGNQTHKAYQPDFIVNNKGTKIVFKSTFGIAGTDLYLFDFDSGEDPGIPSPPQPSPPPPANNPPSAYGGAFSTAQGVAVNGTLSAEDPDGNPLTYSIVSNGSLGVAKITNATTGAFTYTPNAQATGTDTFTFKVSDGKAESNAATVTVTIKPKPVSQVRAKLRLVSNNYAYPGEGWDNAIDGDTVGWDGTVTAKDNPPYCIFAFADNSNKTVSKIRLMTDTGVALEYPKFQSRWVTQFTVQVSTTDTNASSFKTLLGKAGKKGGGWQDYSVPPTQAKYIKLILDQPSSGWRQIGEFEVYVNQ